jgi:hypothetical protein
MSFTYFVPPQSPKDEVRFWSTDTVEKPYSVSDEEITYLLEQLSGNVMEAAAVVADRIANYFSLQQTDAGGATRIGPFQVTGDRSTLDMERAWRALAARLRSGSSNGLPILSGSALFTGTTEPEFSVGMQDNGYQRFPERSRQPRPVNGVY